MLQSERACLTEIRKADSAELAAWINDPDLVRLNAAYRPVHQVGHDAWFDSLATESGRAAFAIRGSGDGPILGIVQLIEISQIHRSAELTIRIGESASRGKGIGTAALRLALGHAFRDLGLNRVWLRVWADNAPAIRAYEKAGFTREGVMRQAVFIDGAFKDVVVMGALAPR